MKINNSHAGTFESGDILIQLFPPEKDGIEIELESSVANQFGEQIKKVIKDSLEEYGITDARVKAVDKGALDCTIRARVTAAAVRATGKDVWKD
jgi:citrate lyase subunit gamma (acyl carrier protein)